jgi:large subunit ribosomal protein L6
MSRIGKKPVDLPDGITAKLADGVITVKGKAGELKLPVHSAMTVKIDEAAKSIVVTRPDDTRSSRALHGLTRTLVANMVEGVTTGFKKVLEITGVGYKAEIKPYGALLSLGFSHQIEYKAPAGVSITAPNPTTVVIEGSSKEHVGQVAAEIRSFRKPEPYKGKGVKYQGEVVRRKAGKAGGK